MPIRRPTTLARLLAALSLTLAGVLPAAAQDSVLGRNLAATCANCHGTNGQASGAMSPLAGMPADRLLGTLAAFKSGTLPATVMHQIVKGYTDDQLKLIAAYFAAQKPKS